MEDNLRVITIENCWQCPYHDHDNQEDPAKYGKSWCWHLNTEIKKPDPIPEICPLPKPQT